jgi:hypothetical protein
MSIQNFRLIGIFVAVAALLLVVYATMWLTGDMKWSRFDFTVAGMLLFGTGIAIELVLRKVRNTTHRLAICAAIVFVLFVIWAELAVGLIGTPFAGS